jgi:hypothetical protein
MTKFQIGVGGYYHARLEGVERSGVVLLCTYWGACSPAASFRVKQVTQQDASSSFFIFLYKTQQAAGGYWPTRSTTEPLFNTAHLAFPILKCVFLKSPLFQKYQAKDVFCNK